MPPGTERDAGIERVRSLTKGAAFASVAAVAVAGVYLSQALPGHSATSGGTTGGTTGAATPSVSPASGGASSSAGASSSGGGSSSYVAPSAPAYSPAPAYQAPVVSSGSS